MIMATVAESPGNCVTFWDVSWDFYEQFLEEFKGRYVPHTYDDGALEIMSPVGLEHEGSKKLISWLVQVLVEELEIPIRCLGSLTIRNQRKAKGIEPDECFYIVREPEMRSQAHYDPDRDPPPDLAIEVDWTNASLPRMPVYARLEVPEIWRFADEQLTVYCLTAAGDYEESDQSLAFPFLPLDEFRPFTVRDPAIDETTWIRRFREWVRTSVRK
jgi:Uma2 family endonuclease